MAKIIQQETFDSVLKENIVEFSMSVEEAREETIKQLEAQGINLANIIKDMDINEETGVSILNENIDSIKAHVDKTAPLTEEQLNKCLDLLISELNKSVPHRVLASKHSTHDFLVQMMHEELQKKPMEHEKDSVIR